VIFFVDVDWSSLTLQLNHDIFYMILSCSSLVYLLSVLFVDFFLYYQIIVCVVNAFAMSLLELFHYSQEPMEHTTKTGERKQENITRDEADDKGQQGENHGSGEELRMIDGSRTTKEEE